MIALHIEGATRAMGKDQPEYITLWVKDIELADGSYCMVTAWELTEMEVVSLHCGATVAIELMGAGTAHFQPTLDMLTRLGNATTLYLAISGTVFHPLRIWVDMETNEGVSTDDGIQLGPKLLTMCVNNTIMEDC